MRVNTNNWNKIRYTLYAPGYDLAGRMLNYSRQKSIASLDIKANDKILIVGAGTGLDLEFLPKDCSIVATDITPAMIEKIKKRSNTLKRNVEPMVMDGQALAFPDESFDIVILHLIVSVIPDAIACVQESERVLRKGGQVVVFDKFVARNKKVSLLRKTVNIFTNLLFSDITRNFESIIKHTKLTVISDVNADFNGNFRRIKLIKN